MDVDVDVDVYVDVVRRNGRLDTIGCGETNGRRGVVLHGVILFCLVLFSSLSSTSHLELHVWHLLPLFFLFFFFLLELYSMISSI